MQINEEFLTENNITKEDYESYYNSLELPVIKRSVNKFGLITLTAADISICFREDEEHEDDVALRLEDEYRKSQTEVHFLELTRQNQTVVDKEEPISSDEKWKNDVMISLEYLTCLAELNIM